MFITQGKTNREFLLIVLILAAIAGGGILWLAGQEIPQPPEIKLQEKVKDETASWQTYRNEWWGFEIKHPKSFENTYLSQGFSMAFNDSIYNPNSKENKFGETGGFQFGKAKNNHEDWVEFAKRQYAHIYSAKPENNYTYGLKIVEFRGLKSVQFYAKNGYGEDGEGGGFAFSGPEVLKIIYFEKDGNLWRLMLPDTSTYNQMLYTFRFLE